jgi:hypothetical protein
MQGQENDQNDVEQYLEMFQLRRVRPLEIPQPTGNSWLRWSAVAAMVVLATAISVQLSRHAVKVPKIGAAHGVRTVALAPRPHMTTSALTKLALEDDKAFDAFLTDQSRAAFPSIQGERSALRVLSKE